MSPSNVRNSKKMAAHRPSRDAPSDSNIPLPSDVQIIFVVLGKLLSDEFVQKLVVPICCTAIVPDGAGAARVGVGIGATERVAHTTGCLGVQQICKFLPTLRVVEESA
eukprot:gene25122-biopygen10422